MIILFCLVGPLEVFLVLHNPAQEAVAATLSIDLPALALEGAGGTSVLTGNALAMAAGTMSLTLGPQATEMVRLRRP